MATMTDTPLSPSATQGEINATYLSDPVLSGTNGQPLGISTVGFRSAKYTPGEWHESNYRRYHQAMADMDGSEHNRNESRRTIKETDALTQKNQAEATKR